MKQYTYDTIIKIVSYGAPALANELCGELQETIIENNTLRNEVDTLKKRIDELTSTNKKEIKKESK